MTTHRLYLPHLLAMDDTARGVPEDGSPLAHPARGTPLDADIGKRTILPLRHLSGREQPPGIEHGRQLVPEIGRARTIAAERRPESGWLGGRRRVAGQHTRSMGQR